MADNVLKATITADGKSFTKTLSELEAQLKRFQAELKNTSSVESFNRINRAIDATKSRIASINGAGNPFQKITQGSSAATQSLINTGRVLNDLPYGIVGIANNLNPLFEGFDRLKNETGSVSKAFKAMGQSLIGPAGIGLAIAAVSSAFIYFGHSLFGVGSASKISEAELKSLGETMDDVKDSVQSLSKELQFLNQLGGINVKIRGQGQVQDLREQSIAQRQLTADLQTQKDKLNAIGEQIAKDTKLNADDRQKAAQQNADAIKSINNEIADSENKSRLIYRQIELQKVEDRKDALKKNQEAFDKYVSETISKAKELAAFLNERSIRDIQFDIDPRDTVGQTFEKAKKFLAATKDITANFKVKLNTLVEPVLQVTDPNNFKGLAGQTQDLRDKLEKEIDRLTSRNPILIEFNKLQIRFAADRQKLREDVAALGNDIKSSLGGAIEGIASSLGDALSGKNFAASIIGVIGDLITQIGRALIKFAIVRGILDKVLKNPFIPAGVAFALGAAAIAIGQLVKNIKPVGARASGGGVNAGQGVLIGERGPEIFVPNSAGRIIPNNAIGGATGRVQPQTVQVTGEFVLRGTTLTAAITQALKSQNRLS